MRLWMAYATMGLSIGLILALALAGCYSDPPSYPTPNITVSNSPGAVVVIPTGSGSAGAGGDATSQPISSPPNNSSATTDTK